MIALSLINLVVTMLLISGAAYILVDESLFSFLLFTFLTILIIVASVKLDNKILGHKEILEDE